MLAHPGRFCTAPAFLVVAVCLWWGAALAAEPAASAPPQAVQMAIDLLGRDDPEFRSIGLERIRHGLRGEEATKRLSSLLQTAAPARSIELLLALADRGDQAAVPAILSLLSATQDSQVRVAALEAVGRLGSGHEVSVLKQSLAAADPEKTAARRALVCLRGADVTQALVEAAKSDDTGLRPVFIDILTERRTLAALPDLVAAAIDADAAVRAAAMRALGQFGGPAQVAGMVQGLLKATAGGEREAAERAIVTVCTKNAGSTQAAAAFLEQFKAADEGKRETLLPTLGRIGGAEALALVDGLVADTDPATRKQGLTALARWPDATVAPRLLDLLAKAQDPSERELLLASLISIAPRPDNTLNDRQKLELLVKTMTLCQRDEDRRRVLERANAIRTVDTLRFVVPYLDNPALAEPACLSVVELAHHRDLRDSNKEEFSRALDKVIATTKNAEFTERAERYKQGQTWERKKPDPKG